MKINREYKHCFQFKPENFVNQKIYHQINVINKIFLSCIYQTFKLAQFANKFNK